MTGSCPPQLVMAFHPAYRGFGWVVFEGPGAPIDWGLTYARGDRQAAYLRHLQTLMERHRPEVLVVERDGRDDKVSRSFNLCAAASALAEGLHVEVRSYGRDEVRDALGLGPKATRHQVAEAVAKHIAAFRHRLPRERRPWESVDRRMALFTAAALALTHYGADDSAPVYDTELLA